MTDSQKSNPPYVEVTLDPAFNKIVDPSIGINPTFQFTSDEVAHLSNKSVTIVPTEDLRDYARTMRGYLIHLGVFFPNDKIWKKIVLDTISAQASIDFAHRLTKIVKLVNEYYLSNVSDYQIEYDFIGKTHQFLAEYEAENGKPISSI